MWIESTPAFVIDKIGNNRVLVASPGFDKARITVILEFTASGEMLVPTIIFKGSPNFAGNWKDIAGRILEKHAGKLLVQFSDSAYGSMRITKEYVPDTLLIRIINLTLSSGI